MINLQKNVLLKDYSSFKIGGPAKFFAEVNSIEELRDVLRLAKSQTLDKIAILGGGAKVLIDDKGFDGLVIHNKIGGILRQGSGQVEAGSGVLMRDLINFCIENSLSGLEWAGGLPGTVGGAVLGNAGAFKGEAKDSVVEVKSLNLETLSEKIRSNAQCQFAYRNSIFKSGEGTQEMIISVIFSLRKGEKAQIQKSIAEKIAYRYSKHPMEYPSIGSTFKNIPLGSLSPELQKEFSAIVKMDPFPVVLVNKLFALCGLKGKRVGGAMISDKHPNFIVNVDNARAVDVKTLIQIAKKAVKTKYNIVLEEEIIYLN